MRIHTKVERWPMLADKIMSWLWNWNKPLCSDCKDTGKILVGEDGEEEFCSCLKGQEILNQLAK